MFLFLAIAFNLSGVTEQNLSFDFNYMLIGLLLYNGIPIS